MKHCIFTKESLSEYISHEGRDKEHYNKKQIGGVIARAQGPWFKRGIAIITVSTGVTVGQLRAATIHQGIHVDPQFFATNGGTV